MKIILFFYKILICLYNANNLKGKNMKLINNTNIRIKILGTILGITIFLSTVIFILIFFLL